MAIVIQLTIPANIPTDLWEYLLHSALTTGPANKVNPWLTYLRRRKHANLRGPL